jgi:hypothetical protein
MSYPFAQEGHPKAWHGWSLHFQAWQARLAVMRKEKKRSHDVGRLGRLLRLT